MTVNELACWKTFEFEHDKTIYLVCVNYDWVHQLKFTLLCRHRKIQSSKAPSRELYVSWTRPEMDLSALSSPLWFTDVFYLMWSRLHGMDVTSLDFHLQERNHRWMVCLICPSILQTKIALWTDLYCALRIFYITVCPRLSQHCFGCRGSFKFV